jgi:YebC/PmpR family DNA-binding regulatory protein
MSGHSKWANIKHKKAHADAKRGKIFSRISKEVTIATKIGGKDIDTNPRLRSAIAAAKSANMPNDNIDRAIKKGAGELGDAIMEELCYEGYAPGGVAIVVDCLTENRNRTAADIRSIFTKANGNLAKEGAVGWMFHRKSRFLVQCAGVTEDSVLEFCLENDLDVEDVSIDNDQAEIIASVEAFNSVVNVLETSDYVIRESGIVRIAETDTSIDVASTARQIMRLVDNLEDNDDVQSVFTNADFTDSVMEEVDKD